MLLLLLLLTCTTGSATTATTATVVVRLPLLLATTTATTTTTTTATDKRQYTGNIVHNAAGTENNVYKFNHFLQVKKLQIRFQKFTLRYWELGKSLVDI